MHHAAASCQAVVHFAPHRGVTYGFAWFEAAMIKLTRHTGELFVLNAELICYIEAAADTFVTLTSGQRLVVRESLDEVMRLAVEYQQSKCLLPAPRLERAAGRG
jgi:flagellar protein FlbD